MKAIKDGTFREDLYYRLNVLPIALKPLRHRPEDIEPLVQLFLSKWNNKSGESRIFSKEALKALKTHPWPGNIRELENIVSRTLAKVNSNMVDISDLEDEFKTTVESPLTLDLVEAYRGIPIETKARERDILLKLIEQMGSLSKTAKLLNIAKSTLHERLKTLGIQMKTITEERV